MYTINPSFVHVRPTTNAVANTSNVGVALLAAPGAGLYYRIIGISVAAGREVAAANMVEVVYITGSGATIWSATVSGGGNTATIDFKYPGIFIGINDTLTMTNISNAVSQTYRTTVYYYVSN